MSAYRGKKRDSTQTVQDKPRKKKIYPTYVPRFKKAKKILAMQI